MVPAVVFDGTAAEAELWRIGENLMRKELTDLERAEQIARRIGLTEEQKQTAQVAPPDANRYPKRGIRQVARELGLERRTIQPSIPSHGAQEVNEIIPSLPFSRKK
jgi:hypothetical protein